MYINFGMSMKTDRENVLNVCLCVRVCTYALHTLLSTQVDGMR